MQLQSCDAIGALDIQFLTNALIVLDRMEKSADIRLLRAEKKLGGRSVTLFVGGSTDDVGTAIDTAFAVSETLEGKPVKAGFCIGSPHAQILKLLDQPETGKKSDSMNEQGR